MKALKVALVAPAYLPAEAFGGPVRSISAIAKTMHRCGYNVKVFTTNVRDPVRPSVGRLPSLGNVEGVPVERYRPTAFIAGYWITLSLFAGLMRENSDLIFAHCARSFQLDLSAIISFLRRKPLIVAPHGSVYSYGIMHGSMRRILYLLHNAALKLVFRRACRIVASSQEEVRQISRFGVDQRKVVLIPNFLDEDEFDRLPPEGNFRQRYGLSPGDKMILFVGRLSWVKGIDTLVKAFASLLKNRHDAWLVLVGPDGGDHGRVLALSKERECSHRIITPGALYGMDKLEAFVDSDIVVMPSLYESFGIVALEAFGCGKPVVGSRVGGLKELIIPERTGLLFERGDENQLECMLQSLLDDPILLRSMGSRARELVLQKYSDRAVGKQVLAMCEEMRREAVTHQRVPKHQ